jgi:ATP-binding cassette subfamily B protein
VENLKKEAIDETVSIALHKAALFSGTIRSNLLIGKKDATEEEMWRALTVA